MALRYWLALWGFRCCQAALGQASCPEDATARDAATSMVQMSVAMQRKKVLKAGPSGYWYPSRGVNDNRSGWSAAYGPWPFRSPSWQYEVPGLNFHQTPCIDDQMNVYSGSDQGTLLSFTRDGTKRWEKNFGTTGCQNPALYDDLLYTTCASGEVLALKMATGEKVWSRKIAEQHSTDTYTVSATKDHLIVPMAAIGSPIGGSYGLALLERSDGQVRWTFNITENTGGTAYTINMAPCITDDSIITSDTSGGIYCLRIQDGSVIWKVPGVNPGTFTLGGVACGEGMVFNGFSKEDGSGGLQALNQSTGERIWMKDVPKVIHNAPAVGRLWGMEKVGVVVGIGQPATFPSEPLKPANITGTVIAVDATTNETLWTFEPPPWLYASSAGSTVSQPCLPDLFSAATIGGDGTVYINWSAGGITYALRDANSDGMISADDPSEVSAYDLGSAATGPPAIAPGMIFVNTCRRPSAFLESL